MGETKSKDAGEVTAGCETIKRFDLAQAIILFVFIVIIVLSVSAIWTANHRISGKDSFDSVKEILNILLPVLSAWIGAVIAFYFGRDNYESAAKSSEALFKHFTSSEEKLKSTLMNDVMIDIATATKFVLNKAAKDVVIKTDLIDAILEKDKRERLPILDSNGLIKYMAHRSLLDKFIVREFVKGKAMDKISLQDMLDDKDFSLMLKDSFKTLPAKADLGQAKALMDNITICNDVFATEDGSDKTRVLGWVTNIVIEKAARV